MLILAGFAFGIAVLGMTAVTLAQRERFPCTACRKSALAMSRDFMYRCPVCKTAFRRKHGELERVEPSSEPA
jgi:tRNA(Ile2) C34 agmatinyltransferase TiaS